MTNLLGKINHVVVLMLENRSFDTIAGFLYDPRNAPPYDQIPHGQAFESLAGKNLTNPMPGGGNAPVLRGSSFTGPDPDPGEEFEHINVQLYGVNPPPSPLPATAPMTGFVQDYAQVIHDFNLAHPRHPLHANAGSIMACFTPDQVPVISALAYNYAICDHWFCSVPSQTWPNRSFVHAATSNG